VLTIAAVHERLYGGPEVGRVAIVGYLQALVADIHASTGAEAAGRAVRLEVAPKHELAVWDADRATTLGLVATELVTNALKYGAGEVVLRFEAGGESTAATLVVEDEGTGPPADFDAALSRGLGMRLLTSLLRGGGLELDRRAGRTRFIAALPPAPSSTGTTV
jgi:two-component sensor histidine kinase